MRLFAFMFLLGVCALCAATPVQVGQARIVELPDGAQVVFDLSASVEYRSFVLNNPPRFVIDLSNARFTTPANKLKLQSSDVRGVRIGVRAGINLRIVVDLLNHSSRSEVYIVDPTKTGGHRLVVDIYRGQPAVSGKTSSKSRRVAQVKSVVPARKDYVIAIDPGHGGKDPGAIGARKTQEKHVVMQISRRLKKLVDREPGMRAILTRDKDSYLRLYERIRIARKHQADLFISIHADAFNNSRARGSSVFILSTKGASSAAARWLAKKENNADLIGGGTLIVEDDALKPVVFDIFHDAILADSLRLAEQVLAELSKVGHVHTGTVERAGFAVLKSPDIPSILVETAFISNAREEAKLRTARHQQKIAQAIMNGMRAYFRNRPPRYIMASASPLPATPTTPEPIPEVSVSRRTSPQAMPKPASQTPINPEVSQPAFKLVSRQSSRKTSKAASQQVHVIKRGESLADIARHYQIGLPRLRSANGLQSNQLRMPAGTFLTIPVSDG